MNSSPYQSGQWTRRIAMLFCIALPSALIAYLWGYSSLQRPSKGSGEVAVAERYDSFVVQGRSMAPTLNDGEVCEVDTSAGQFQVGDLVIFDWQGQRHLKRVAALGGDVVDLEEGRMTVDGVRVEDRIAARSEERFIRPKRISLPTLSEQWTREAEFQEWLIFQYRNLHAAGRPTAVMDDYPNNTDVRRTLHPVDRLVASIRSLDGESLREFDVAFWIDGKVYVSRTVEGVATSLSAIHSTKVDMIAPQLRDSSPIAIRISTSDQSKFEFNVTREIEYRAGPRSSQVQYPLTLSDDQFFVVGDNVPISIDSRSIGPVSRRQIIGKVVGVVNLHRFGGQPE